MAARVRANGDVLCAAMHPAAPGDTYLDDGLHYRLASDLKVLVTEPMHLPGGGGHVAHGQWWWRGNVPPHVQVDPYYGAA